MNVVAEEREEKNNVIKNGATEYKLCVKSKSTVELRKIYSKNAINGKSKIQIYDYITYLFHTKNRKNLLFIRWSTLVCISNGQFYWIVDRRYCVKEEETNILLYLRETNIFSLIWRSFVDLHIYSQSSRSLQ